MSIIYSYPIKGTPANDDLILISDSASSPQFATKQIKVSSLPGGSSSGVSSFNTLTGAVTITGGTNVTLNTVGNNIEINAASGGGTPATPTNSVQFNNAGAFGGSANLTFATNTLAVTHTVDIKGDGTNAGKLKLYCQNTTTPHAVTIEGPDHTNAAAYTLKLPSPAPANNQILQYTTSGNLGWINTPASTAPQGSDGQFQYKNGSSFAGTDTLRFDADKIHMGRSTSPITRGQLVMYGDGTNASDIQLYNSGNNRFLKIAQQAGATQDLTLTFPGVAPGGNTKILQSDSSGQLSWIDTPSGSGGVSQVTAGGVIPVSTGAPLIVSPTSGNVVATSASYDGGSNVGHVPTGGSNITFLRGDGTWVTPTNTNTNTNIANTNLQLDNNRNLDLSNGNAADYALTFISTLGGVSKNLFKFDQIGATSPKFTVGHTESAYEGTILLEGNGSNRTGQVQLENAAGTYYTSFQAPTTFGANQNIYYTLPNLQGVANSVLTNNGSGALSWSGITEEATWTPTSPNSNTISSATGKYTKVGNTVFASFAFTMTGSTSVALSGLPFSGVYTSGNKGTSIISVNNCASVQGQIVGGQMVAATSFAFNAYTGSGAGLPTKLQTTTSSLYQTSGGTYAGIIIYQTS